MALASVVLIVLLLALAEGAVRLLGVQPREWPAAEKVTFRGMEVDPLLGPMPRPGWSGRWMTGFDVAFDRHGFRTTGYPPPAQPRARVAFLGDSCTFGWGLNTPDTFVAQLDARQRAEADGALELMNAAWVGQSALSGLYILRERVLPLHPNLVVLAFSANNAYRFSIVGDAQRFRLYGLRKLLLRSRLFHVLGAALASRRPRTENPRARRAVLQSPLSDVHRVAAPDEFADALRAMVNDSRAAGAAVLLLLLPRASEVGPMYQREDVGYLRAQPTPGKPGAKNERDVDLLQLSCLDHRRLAQPLETLRQQRSQWEPVYPADAVLAAVLRQAADAYVRGEYAAAVGTLSQAVTQHPRSPLAHYDLGVATFAAGDRAAALAHLREADRLACNAFVHYAVALWEVAIALDVPVLDFTMNFQAQPADSLFGDAAHPSVTGARVIADALWPLLRRLGS